MPPIFVNTDNTVKPKLFDGAGAGKSSAAAEAKMQKAVKRIIDKAAGFTTMKSNGAKGYSIRLKVAKLTVADHKTRCELSGEIVRYPEVVNHAGSKGALMVSTSLTGGATATGTDENSLLDCVEAVAEELALKAVPAMKTDMTRR